MSDFDNTPSEVNLIASASEFEFPETLEEELRSTHAENSDVASDLFRDMKGYLGQVAQTGSQSFFKIESIYLPTEGTRRVYVGPYNVGPIGPARRWAPRKSRVRVISTDQTNQSAALGELLQCSDFVIDCVTGRLVANRQIVTVEKSGDNEKRNWPTIKPGDVPRIIERLRGEGEEYWPGNSISIYIGKTYERSLFGQRTTSVPESNYPQAMTQLHDILSLTRTKTHEIEVPNPEVTKR